MVEVLQAVVAETDIDAHERARSFVNIGREAEIADRKSVFAVGVECRSVVFRSCETHQRRDRNFVAPVHAQTCRVDSHGRKVRPEEVKAPAMAIDRAVPRLKVVCESSKRSDGVTMSRSINKPPEF